MSTNEAVAIQRLLGRNQANALLQTFASSVPGLELAIFRTDGTLFVQTDGWNKKLVNLEGLQKDSRLYPLSAASQPVGTLVAQGKSSSKDNPLERAVQQSLDALLAQSLDRREVANEALERYREINLMYRVSETIGALLDVGKIPQMVLEEGQRVIHAKSGIVLLSPPNGGAEWEIKASDCVDSPAEALKEIARQALGDAWQSERAAILTELPTQSLRAILYAPLKGKNNVLGAIILSRAPDQPVFTASDSKLLMALASQAAISVENARLHLAVLEKERLEHELELARDVQASLIPSQTPSIPGWDFAAFWQPAREVSGDFYDFISDVGTTLVARDLDTEPGSARAVGPSRQGIVIADVSDKGMHAALFMALTRSIVRASTTAGLSPADGLTQTNRLLCADSVNGMFVTLFYSQLDPQKHELTYVNAGHNPPLHYRSKEKMLAELTATGIMLGFDESRRLEQRSVKLEPGDFVLFYTDGVTEAMNEQNDQYGEERLWDLLHVNSSASASDLLHAVRISLAGFVGNRAQSDDITIVIAKRLAA
jgi:serine phosphatase RsbU (regulator of sigma subunit)